MTACRPICRCRWLLGCLLLLAGPATAEVVPISTGGRNVVRLTVAKDLIVGSTYDQRVCAWTLDGRLVWETPTTGFVFDLASGDLNGDSRAEIVGAAADGRVYAWSHCGQLLWSQDLTAPVYQAAVARLDGAHPCVLASGINRQLVALTPRGELIAEATLNGAGRMMRAGDLDGDGADEVVVLPIRGQAKDLVLFKGTNLARVKGMAIPSGEIPWKPQERFEMARARAAVELREGWDGQSLKKANGVVADLDGDGCAELVYPPGVYTLRGGVRQVFALPGPLRQNSYDAYYNMRLLAVGNLTDEPGAEIVIVEGPQLCLYSSSGRELGRATAPWGFTDVAVLPGAPLGSALLASAPGGDDHLYRLTFTPGWERAFSSLRAQGRRSAISSNIQAIAQRAASWHGTPMPGADGPYDVVVHHYLWSGATLARFDQWVSEVRAYEQEFPYPCLRFSTCIWPGEKAPLKRPDGQPWPRDHRLAHDVPRDLIVEAARKFEQAGCHFWVQVGHGCSPHLEVATAAAMLDAAPRTLLGFVTAEDEQLDQIPYYYDHHIRPILELCLRHHKRFICRHKDIWWAHWPAEPRMRTSIFDGRFRSVILPSVEDSNSRCAEVNLAARIGLWLDGRVDDWASRCCADWYCVSRAWEWEYVMSGHGPLRYYVAQALWGARVFMFLNGEKDRDGKWTRTGREGAATFLHLLGKGIITPPRREQLRAISPVALVVVTNSARFVQHGSNGHHEEQWNTDGTDRQRWAFDRLDAYWAMAPLPPTDVATYLWGRTRRDPRHLPVTAPYGLVLLCPGGVSRPGLWRALWGTDGDRIWPLHEADAPPAASPPDLEEARRRLCADLEHWTATLPFRVEGPVLHNVIECGPEAYVTLIMDSGWLDPADRVATLSSPVADRWVVRDRLTGDLVGSLEPGGAPLHVHVPAGTFRLLDIQRAR